MKGNYYTEEEKYWLEGGNTGMLPTRITPSGVNVLGHNEIFVFGSTFTGKHVSGAAKAAKEKFGAIMGVGEGLQGKSYAIPSKGKLEDLQCAVERFISFAKQHQELIFYVTPIGCGGAGFEPILVAPFFIDAAFLGNVMLPISFWKIIRNIIPGEKLFDKMVSDVIDFVKYQNRYGDPMKWHGSCIETLVESIDNEERFEIAKRLKLVPLTSECPHTKGFDETLTLEIIHTLRHLR